MNSKLLEERVHVLYSIIYHLHMIDTLILKLTMVKEDYMKHC